MREPSEFEVRDLTALSGQFAPPGARRAAAVAARGCRGLPAGAARVSP
jgi:hypothetical protein